MIQSFNKFCRHPVVLAKMAMVMQPPTLGFGLDAVQILSVETTEKDVRMRPHCRNVAVHVAQEDVAVDVGKHHIEAAADGRCVAKDDFDVGNAVQF